MPSTVSTTLSTGWSSRRRSAPRRTAARPIARTTSTSAEKDPFHKGEAGRLTGRPLSFRFGRFCPTLTVGDDWGSALPGLGLRICRGVCRGVPALRRAHGAVRPDRGPVGAGPAWPDRADAEGRPDPARGLRRGRDLVCATVAAV